MMKTGLILLLLVNLGFGADWYASSGTAAMSAITWYPTPGAGCVAGTGTTLVWGAQASGDNFYANSCTAISVAADPGPNGAVTLRTDAGAGTAGGGFTYATAANLTLHANIQAGTTVGLSISGSTGGGTITGNVTGGSATNARGVSDSHTGAGITITVQGTVTGGSISSAAGYHVTSAATVSVTGGVYASSTASGLDSTSATSVITVSGICHGNDSANTSGCLGATPGGLTVTGPLVNGKNGPAALGVFYTPVAGSYVCSPKDSSYAIDTEDCTHTGGGAGLSAHAVELPTNPGVSNVRTGTAYGTFTGTMTGGGSYASAQ